MLGASLLWRAICFVIGLNTPWCIPLLFLLPLLTLLTGVFPLNEGRPRGRPVPPPAAEGRACFVAIEGRKYFASFAPSLAR